MIIRFAQADFAFFLFSILLLLVPLNFEQCRWFATGNVLVAIGCPEHDHTHDYDFSIPRVKHKTTWVIKGDIIIISIISIKLTSAGKTGGLLDGCAFPSDHTKKKGLAVLFHGIFLFVLYKCIITPLCVGF